MKTPYGKSLKNKKSVKNVTSPVLGRYGIPTWSTLSLSQRNLLTLPHIHGKANTQNLQRRFLKPHPHPPDYFQIPSHYRTTWNLVE